MCSAGLVLPESVLSLPPAALHCHVAMTYKVSHIQATLRKHLKQVLQLLQHELNTCMHAARQRAQSAMTLPHSMNALCVEGFLLLS